MNKILLLIKTNSPTDLLIHLGIVLTLGLITFMIFFNSFLPSITYHRETVTMPDVQGMSITELEEFLKKRDLTYEIKDSSYSRNHKPNVVISQSPLPGAKVKRYRKIFITVNPKNPPLVAMPRLIDMPFSEARRALLNEGLELGRIEYKAHIAENVILEQTVLDKNYTVDNLEEFKKGILIPKGTRIDLVVGDGLGEREFPMPDLAMMPLDEAEFVIKGHELIRGNIRYDYNSSREIGTVLSQNPLSYIGKVKDDVKPGSNQDARKKRLVRAGEIVDLVVAGNPAARPEDEAKLTDEERRRRDSLNQNLNIRSKEDFEKIRKKRLGIEDKEKKEPDSN
jgi:beta-lactam-binding protein with PASTA domain